jgi:multiple sugar transport system ATP-binding protein
MNLVDGTVTCGRIKMAEGQSLPLPPASGQVMDGQKVKLGIRPEWFTPVLESKKNNDEVSLTIDVIEPTGPDVYVALHLGDTEIIARLPADARLKVGVTQTFQIDHARAVLFDADTGEAITKSKQTMQC